MSKKEETNTNTDSDLHTPAELKEMQEWPLEWKIIISKQKITEWYEQNDGKVYVSFSGGKDSTVLLDIVRGLYPDVKAVFVDTGLEFPEIREFVKSVPNVVWVRPEMSFRQVIEKYGYPLVSKEVAKKICSRRNKPDGCMAQLFEKDSDYNKKYHMRYSLYKWKDLADSDIPISHMCCDVMKKKPAKQFEKESGLKPITGTMACESSIRKKNWMKHGCNSYNANHPMSQPLSFWTEQDILKYYKEYNPELRYASVYGNIVSDENGVYHTTGCRRTGCVFCAFGAHLEKEPNRFQQLKETHPQLWKYCMKPWEDGGLGMRTALEKIGVACE